MKTSCARADAVSKFSKKIAYRSGCSPEIYACGPPPRAPTLRLGSKELMGCCGNDPFISGSLHAEASGSRAVSRFHVHELMPQPGVVQLLFPCGTIRQAIGYFASSTRYELPPGDVIMVASWLRLPEELTTPQPLMSWNLHPFKGESASNDACSMSALSVAAAPIQRPLISRKVWLNKLSLGQFRYARLRASSTALRSSGAMQVTSVGRQGGKAGTPTSSAPKTALLRVCGAKVAVVKLKSIVPTAPALTWPSLIASTPWSTML